MERTEIARRNIRRYRIKAMMLRAHDMLSKRPPRLAN
jgi:hypothetical protein